MEPSDRNRRAWEEAHRQQEPEAEQGLPEAVRERLPELEGRHVLQLGGGASAGAELAARGALVTVLAVDAATVTAGLEAAPTAAWIHGDVHAPPLELQRSRFHLVVADAGAIREPRTWARGVEAALRPGGYVLVFGDHPAGSRLDAMRRWRGDYFDGRAPTLGALVTAVARAGLVIRRLEELRSLRPERRATPYAGAFVLVARRPAS